MSIERWRQLRTRARGMTASDLVREAARRGAERTRRRRRAADAAAGRAHAAASDADVRAALARLLTTCPVAPGLVDPRSAGAWIAASAAGVARRSVEEAERILGGFLRPFTGEPVAFGWPIAWRTDWVSGRTWPLEHFTALTPIHPDESDIRRVWEFNRLQHTVALGRAWAVTGDERYPEAFFRHLASWVADNPVEMGPNWSNAMEAGVRAANLVTAFHLMRQSAAVEAHRELLARTFIEHGRYVADNLEITHRITSNHYMCDLAGLLFLGLGIPDLPPAGAWVALAWPRFVAEVRKQVLPDGVDYEASTAYHRFVLEIVLSVLLLARSSGREAPEDVWEKLEAMFAVHRAVLRPDGSLPLIGDSDDGRFIVWGERPAVDAAYLLSVGAMCFNRKEFATAGPSDEAVWLFGRDGCDRLATLGPDAGPRRSTVFPDGGLAVMHGGGTFLVVDAGGHGIGGRGSHNHNDALSFDLFAGGRSVIVDPGTYIYTGDPVWRDRFRQTLWHNTIRVDGDEIAPFVPGAPFALGPDPRPRILSWSSTDDGDELVADHRGYDRSRRNLVHRRVFHLDRATGTLDVDDTLEGTGDHAFEFSLTLDAGCRLASGDVPGGHGTAVVVEDAASGRLLVRIAVASAVPLAFRVEERFVSRAYGRKLPCVGLVWSGRAPVPVRLQTRIEPADGVEAERA